MVYYIPRGSDAQQARPKGGRSGHGWREGWARWAGADPPAGGELRSVAPGLYLRRGPPQNSSPIIRPLSIQSHPKTTKKERRK